MSKGLWYVIDAQSTYILMFVFVHLAICLLLRLERNVTFDVSLPTKRFIYLCTSPFDQLEESDEDPRPL